MRSQNAGKPSQRPKFQNFSGGACSQTPRAALCLRHSIAKIFKEQLYFAHPMCSDKKFIKLGMESFAAAKIEKFVLDGKFQVVPIWPFLFAMRYHQMILENIFECYKLLNFTK